MNEPGLPRAIKAVDPLALVFYRTVYTDHDPSPRDCFWPSGADWFNRFWPEYSQIPGVDVWVFTNEWVNNDWPDADLLRLAQFWREMIAEYVRHNVKGTICDFSVGTPSLRAVEILKPVFEEAARQGMYLNYHMYSNQSALGNTDMSYQAEWYAMRWQQIVAGIPGLKVVGLEAGNSGGNGLFRPETPACMMQLADMVKPHSRIVSANWWEITGPGTGWEKDDWTPVLGWYFQWAAAR